VLARKVSHQNVVRVHDVGERDGQIYLVMDYVEGRPLRAWMAEHMSRGTSASTSASRGG
jgi:serine/threonine protein kinase